MSKIEVRDIWMMVPTVRCKGYCVDSCGPINMTKDERALLPEWFPGVEEMHNDNQANPDYHCPLLVDGKCSAYAVRPLVCRLWGAEESMPCPWRCSVVGGELSHAEGSSLMQLMLDTGGGL